MSPIKAREGFILPVLLIILLIISLVFVSLYQAEASHLLLFTAVKTEQTAATSLEDSLPAKLKIITALNAEAATEEPLIPDPILADTPYLRAITESGTRLWQEQSNHFLLSFACNPGSCKLLSMRRIIN